MSTDPRKNRQKKKRRRRRMHEWKQRQFIRKAAYIKSGPYIQSLLKEASFGRTLLMGGTGGGILSAYEGEEKAN